MEKKTRRDEPLTRDRVLEAAVALLDRDGLDALTMRALAEDLGVEAMSLYRYVANKSDLLDGVHGRILSEMKVPSLDGRWREVLRELAREFRRVLGRHPNAVLIFATRAAVTPASFGLVERVLEILGDAGFGGEALHAFQAGVSFVVGHTLWALGGRDDPLKSASLTAAARHAIELAPDEEFEFGLDALLLGLEAKRRQRR